MAEAHIGPYRLLRLLHQGGQGRVFLGQDDRLQRRVAVKIHALPEEPAARRQVLDESRLLARLQHPGVVQVYDVIASDEHLAMVMEYVPGCDLDELLAQAEPGLAVSLDIVEGIAAALGAAANHQIVHGDLKAANVLVSREGRVKLVDFGIAAVVGEARGGRGSLSCLSPEQVRGLPLDTRSDLFALGCLLYRLLAGDYPFYRQGSLDRPALESGACPPLPECAPDGERIPDQLRVLVDQLLAPDPADRPASLAGLRQQLHLLRSDLPRRLHGELLSLAAPIFREEAAEDMPLPLPRDLLQHGSSQWRWWSRIGFWSPALWRRTRILAVLLALPLLAWAAYPLVPSSTAGIRLLPLELRLAPGIALPAPDGPDWVRAAVRDALRQQRLRPLGAGQVAASADEHLHLRLQCNEDLCLLGLTRQTVAGESWRYRQALLPPAAGMWAWQSLIGDAVAGLYRED